MKKTQSAKLAELLSGGNTITSAKIEHKARSKDYRLVGTVDVSPAGRVKSKA